MRRPGGRRFGVVAAFLLVGLGSTALLVLRGSGDPEEAGAGRTPYDWSRDDRLVGLMLPCPGLGHFDRDTSDMLPVLVEKLESAPSQTVLRNVREELAAAGPPAIEELARLVRRLYTEPHGSHAVKNALGVLQMSPDGGSPEGLAVLEACLGHPQEAVRTAAVRAVAEHPAPPLYEQLRSLVPITPAQTYLSLWTALHACDPARFEEDLAAWIEAGTYRGQWALGARLVASGATAETCDRLAVAATTVTDAEPRALLLAALTRGGGSLDPLLALLGSEDPQQRMIALAALAYTDAVEPVIEVLRDDDLPTLRRVAAEQLAGRARERAVRSALYEGISDTDDPTRFACIKALLAVGDEATADYALSMFDGSRAELEAVLRALSGHWEANPTLPERARDLLVQRFDDLAGEPLERKRPLIQALGSVPGAESAHLLLGMAERLEGETIHGVSGYRWIAMQASNAGPEARSVLMQAWREEPDPLRRMDLLWPASSAHDDTTRAFLEEVLLAERSLPHERLYVAERLASEGPASEVAPLLKRAARRLTDATFRPAFECLLWRWYG